MLNFGKLFGSAQGVTSIGTYPEAMAVQCKPSWALHVFMNWNALPLGSGRPVIPELLLFALTAHWLPHCGLSQPTLQIISHLVTTEMAILQLAASITLNLQLALPLLFSLLCDDLENCTKSSFWVHPEKS